MTLLSEKLVISLKNFYKRPDIYEMKIAVIVPQVFDYLVASIIEGLENLNTDYMTSSQYFNKRYASSVVDFLDYAKDANVIVLTSNQGVPGWFDNLTKNTTVRLVYIDGSDQSLHFAPRDIKWSFIFKRELLRNDPQDTKGAYFHCRSAHLIAGFIRLFRSQYFLAT